MEKNGLVFVFKYNVLRSFKLWQQLFIQLPKKKKKNTIYKCYVPLYCYKATAQFLGLPALSDL